jgi:hypothetical protein
MIKALIFIAAAIAGIIIDWGLYARVSLLIMTAKGSASSLSYRDFVFPRLLATILGALAVCYDALHQEGDRRYLLIGMTFFLLSLLYAIAATYWPGRHNHS